MHAKKGVALVTGVTGQDGSYLAEKLLLHGYDVVGTRRAAHTSAASHENLAMAHVIASRTCRTLDVTELDLTCTADVSSVIRAVRPDLVFNMAAQAHVGLSFTRPEYTLNVTGVGAARVLEACIENSTKTCRIYQASTSEMFGGTDGQPLSSRSKFDPKSPYAAAKLMAHQIATMYRKRGAFVSCGILFNHESPRRGLDFVTRKITTAFAGMKVGKVSSLALGTLTARRDWGFAPEYVDVMIRSLEADEPADFVVGTGVSHSVSDIVVAAGRCAGMTADEALSKVSVSDSLARPIEVKELIADTSEALDLFGWKSSVSFEQMIADMFDSDLKIARKS